MLQFALTCTVAAIMLAITCDNCAYISANITNYSANHTRDRLHTTAGPLEFALRPGVFIASLDGKIIYTPANMTDFAAFDRFIGATLSAIDFYNRYVIDGVTIWPGI